MQLLLGSAVVSTAVFGVPPKTPVAPMAPPNGDGEVNARLAGETPARATGPAVATLWRGKTVALPNPSASFRPWEKEQPSDAPCFADRCLANPVREFSIPVTSWSVQC